MKFRILVMATAFLSAVSLYAQTSNDALRLSDPGNLSSARALGMGNSLSSAGNDFSSMFLNPAGLALFDNSELTISGYNNNLKNDATYYGNTLSNSKNSTDFSQIGLVYKFPVSRGSFVLGVGYNKSKDFNRILQFNGFNFGTTSMIQDLTSKNSDFAYQAGVSFAGASNDSTLIRGKLQQSGLIENDGGVNSWSVGFATELQKDLFIGGSLNILNGSFTSKKNYYESDPYKNYFALQLDPTDANTKGFDMFSYYDRIAWDISGWDAKLGFIYKLKDKGTIGAAINFPRYFTIKEDYTLSSIGDFTTTRYLSDVGNSSYEYKIRTPFEFSFGGSYNLEGLLLAADVKYIDYTQMEFTDGLTFADRSNLNDGIKTDYRAVLNYNIGAEYTVPNLGMKVRAGFMMMKSPYKDDPSEYDKKFITAGIGVPFEQIELNAALAYGWWKDYGYQYQSADTPVYQDLKSTTVMFTVKYLIF